MLLLDSELPLSPLLALRNQPEEEERRRRINCNETHTHSLLITRF
uniref:Uncharacterized protein n=1 Tax=Cucumis melo TaxID=3656 RepID=A0A9I9EF10_CUCME